MYPLQRHRQYAVRPYIQYVPVPIPVPVPYPVLMPAPVQHDIPYAHQSLPSHKIIDLLPQAIHPVVNALPNILLDGVMALNLTRHYQDLENKKTMNSNAFMHHQDDQSFHFVLCNFNNQENFISENVAHLLTSAPAFKLRSLDHQNMVYACVIEKHAVIVNFYSGTLASYFAEQSKRGDIVLVDILNNTFVAKNEASIAALFPDVIEEIKTSESTEEQETHESVQNNPIEIIEEIKDNHAATAIKEDEKEEEEEKEEEIQPSRTIKYKEITITATTPDFVSKSIFDALPVEKTREIKEENRYPQALKAKKVTPTADVKKPKTVSPTTQTPALNPVTVTDDAPKPSVVSSVLSYVGYNNGPKKSEQWQRNAANLFKKTYHEGTKKEPTPKQIHVESDLFNTLDYQLTPIIPYIDIKTKEKILNLAHLLLKNNKKFTETHQLVHEFSDKALEAMTKSYYAHEALKLKELKEQSADRNTVESLYLLFGLLVFIYIYLSYAMYESNIHVNSPYISSGFVSMSSMAVVSGWMTVQSRARVYLKEDMKTLVAVKNEAHEKLINLKKQNTLTHEMLIQLAVVLIAMQRIKAHHSEQPSFQNPDESNAFLNGFVQSVNQRYRLSSRFAGQLFLPDSLSPHLAATIHTLVGLLAIHGNALNKRISDNAVPEIKIATLSCDEQIKMMQQCTQTIETLTMKDNLSRHDKNSLIDAADTLFLTYSLIEKTNASPYLAEFGEQHKKFLEHANNQIKLITADSIVFRSNQFSHTLKQDKALALHTLELIANPSHKEKMDLSSTVSMKKQF